MAASDVDMWHVNTRSRKINSLGLLVWCFVNFFYIIVRNLSSENACFRVPTRNITQMHKKAKVNVQQRSRVCLSLLFCKMILKCDLLLSFKQRSNIRSASTHSHTWVERGTARVKWAAQERNTVPRPGLGFLNIWSGVQHANHYATAPPLTQY